MLALPKNPTEWTRESITAYLDKNPARLDPLEGIYERVRLSLEDVTGGKYTVGIIKDPATDEYLIIYLSGAKNDLDWTPGEVKAVIRKTATNGFYSVHWISRDKSLYEDVYANLETGGLSVFSMGVFSITYKFIKMYPLQGRTGSLNKS